MPSSNDEAMAFLKAASVESLGEFGETIWKRVMRASGWHYISLAEIAEGGAPLAHGASGEIILPDLDAFCEGRNAYVEAKAKSQSIMYRNKKQERHGINLRNYTHYRRISEMQKKRCAIAIVELWRDSGAWLNWSGSLLIETLAELGDPRSEHPENPPKVYWPRKAFRHLDSFEPLRLFELYAGQFKGHCGYDLDAILFPAKQAELF